MRAKRKKTPIIIFFFCALLAALAIYQMYDLSTTSGKFGVTGHTSPRDHPKRTEYQKTGQITLKWDPAPRAKSYNIYWSTNPDVNKSTGIKIENVTNPFTIKDLKIGETYYFAVSSVTENGESEISKEIVHTVAQH